MQFITMDRTETLLKITRASNGSKDIESRPYLGTNYVRLCLSSGIAGRKNEKRKKKPYTQP